MSTSLESVNPSGLVKVNLDPSFDDPNLPYRVSFDAERYSQFLIEKGLSEEEVSKKAVTIEKRYSVSNDILFDLHGYYNPFTKNIGICADPFYKMYLDCLKSMNDITVGSKSPKDEYFWELIPKKGIAKIIAGTGNLELDNKSSLLKSGVNNRINKTLLHETGHMLDLRHPFVDKINFALLGVQGVIMAFSFFRVYESLGQYPFLSIPAGLLSSYLVWDLFDIVDPFEIKAKRFAEKEGHNPKWQNIIKIEFK